MRYNNDGKMAELINRKMLENNCRTIEQLAELCGIAPMTINRLLDGKNSPTFSTIIKLCNILNITAQEFWDAATYNEPVSISAE